MTTAKPTLDGLPDEVLHCILCYAPASTALTLERTSRRFKRVTNSPLLWRLHCQNDFKFWDQRHELSQKLTDPASSVDWKGLYALRQQIDVDTTQVLNSILTSQTGRIEKIHRIVEFGYDAKDTLLRHARAGEEWEDHLARRYYSNAILSCLHRTMAIPVWNRLRNSEDISLERALGVFDMFVLETGPGDFNDISACLDKIVTQLMMECPHIMDLSPRNRARRIAMFLRAHDLTGIDPDREYYNIEHNFLGLALRNPGHNSLPLISSAIYCYVARQVGLDAHPCGFPFHVHVIINPAEGYDMDGARLDDVSQPGDPMYMDPFRSIEETGVTELQQQLNFLGALSSSRSSFLREALVQEIVLRCGKNILNSVFQIARVRDACVDPVHVKYAALWSSILFAGYANQGGELPGIFPRQEGVNFVLRRHLQSLMDSIASDFQSDVFLIEQYLVPLFQHLPEYGPLRESVRVLRAGDDIPKQVRRRTSEHKNVKYKIGQVFRHRRYDYVAVITGWDAECGAGEQWMQQMGIDRLRAGKHQSFYHVLVSDKSVRYVAEENIEPIAPEISQLPPSFLKLGGKHFKRWDAQSRVFVSNIRDEYPDD
ncbi:F-box domain-containing protein [Paracoccidioides lutzii Pb01]|uniref:F-box domain-containing protein n=1 Tax=Paracoccidioides lutzii (strain ATCC MYA-826 / Pb01) TaxID=502779 RepID=C1HDT0_PARBA|nr:F-box domain-containing protein [Paracoccidioides lutzii Pb01]EEH40074.2 F-box domain-containing protein [Paracoccidioides lutzii Pb01]